MARRRFKDEEIQQAADKLLAEAKQRRPFISRSLREMLNPLRGASLAVLLAYISHANSHGDAWPSISYLSYETGYGTSLVKAARSKLVSLGLLIPVGQKRHDGSQGVEKGAFAQKIFRLGWKTDAVG